jgi:Peptidase family M1 domain
LKGMSPFLLPLGAGVLSTLVVLGLATAAEPHAEPRTPNPSLAMLDGDLKEMSLDPEETYRVRDFRITRGDLRLYLSDGVISFATPVGGRRMAAIFVTQESELGDAELLVFPPRRGERAALLHFAKTPNLDEHFHSAVFLFTDRTFDELQSHVVEHATEKSPDLAEKLAPEWNPVIRNLAADVETRLLDAMVNGQTASTGFFEGLLAGRQQGALDILYDPGAPEPVAIGKVQPSQGRSYFQLWSSFAPRHTVAAAGDTVHLANYRIDTRIGEDLRQTTETRVDVVVERPRTRSVSFLISERLKVASALVDGKPAEIYQRSSVHIADEDPSLSPFIVVAEHELTPGETHTFTIVANGTVVHREGARGFYVADRNAWFPHRGPEPAFFDLTFRSPERFRVVSIGEPVEEHVADGERVVHRRTIAPVRFAGFNLGEYEEVSVVHGPYRVECFANRDLLMRGDDPEKKDGSGESAEASQKSAEAGKALALERLAEISARTGALLDRYTAEWGPLPIRTLAVSPIPANMGQGFPGLVYLSSLAYLHDDERPPALQNRRSSIFLSEILLAHEVAHQWWGNVVTPADYRSEWVFEALANDAALDLLAQNRGIALRDQVLASFRADLLEPRQDGGLVESVGPIEMGHRLEELGDPDVWRVITYEKGSWIIHMLRQRMGDPSFQRMLQRLITEYAGRTTTNEDLRKLAASYLPPGGPDPKLEEFFESWVYGTGIPKLNLKVEPAGKGKTATRQVEVEVSGVAEDFTVDVPITVLPRTGRPEVRWVKCTAEGGAFLIPRDATAQLPAPKDFLYVP